MNRTPDEHAAEAERLLEIADGFRPAQAHYLGLVTKAGAHAALSLRRPAPKPGTAPARKKTTTTKKKEAGA